MCCYQQFSRADGHPLQDIVDAGGPPSQEQQPSSCSKSREVQNYLRAASICRGAPPRFMCACLQVKMLNLAKECKSMPQSQALLGFGSHPRIDRWYSLSNGLIGLRFSAPAVQPSGVSLASFKLPSMGLRWGKMVPAHCSVPQCSNMPKLWNLAVLLHQISGHLCRWGETRLLVQSRRCTPRP